MCPNSRFRKILPKVVWTPYLLYILTAGTLQKPHFLTPPSNQNAGLFRVVPRMPPRGCKMAPTGPKNGESGVPRDPQGCQRVSQCLLKCSKKTSKISTPAPRVPRVPHRPQNTKFVDVPPPRGAILGAHSSVRKLRGVFGQKLWGDRRYPK